MFIHFTSGIAARHAQVCYGIKKVAVLDFDVHHGNGTEDGFWDSSTLFYGSTHEKDNFPGSDTDVICQVNVVFDAFSNRVLLMNFCFSCYCAGTGKEPTLKGSRAKKEIDRRIVNRYLHRGPGSRTEFRTKWKEVVEEMERFGPELVIISAGFDAHDEVRDITSQSKIYVSFTLHIHIQYVYLQALSFSFFEIT